MKYSKQAWDQLKNITAREIIGALERNGWVQDTNVDDEHTYVKNVGGNRRRVNIHYHPQKTYGANLLKCILGETGWTEEEMRKLKLIK